MVAHRAESRLPRGRAVRARARHASRGSRATRYLRRAEDEPGDTADRLVREAIWRWVTPRWQRHLERIMERERDVDAVVVFTVPMSHFRGIPTRLRERFGVPVVFYDGDVPMSLPEFGGMDTGFNYYHGADPCEYDLVVSNSEGGLERLLELGRAARGGGLLGRRPGVLRAAAGREGARRLLLRLRRQVPARVDGGDGRRAEPAAARGRLRARRPRLPRRHRARRADRRRAVQRLPARDLGGADQPQHHAAAARDRAASSSTAGRSSSPLAGAAIVSNPYEGIERWFEPGRELLVVSSADEAVAAYRELLDDPAPPRSWAARARERVLDEHTYVHRARRLLELSACGMASHVD